MPALHVESQALKGWRKWWRRFHVLVKRKLIIRNCIFKHGIRFTGRLSRLYGPIIIEKCHFVGPCDKMVDLEILLKGMPKAKKHCNATTICKHKKDACRMTGCPRFEGLVYFFGADDEH